VPASERFTAGERVIVSIRPEQLEVHATDAPDRFPARQRLNLPVGGLTVLDLEASDDTGIKLVRLRSPGDGKLPEQLFCGFGAKAHPAVFRQTTA
jgi:putative spermidine/putrescine transport system ATP-binding protein